MIIFLKGATHFFFFISFLNIHNDLKGVVGGKGASIFFCQFYDDTVNLFFFFFRFTCVVCLLSIGVFHVFGLEQEAQHDTR